MKKDKNLPKLSVALATFNEEKNIGGCLESARDLADEIIIVDGSSRDKTVEIAQKYGAKVFVFDNPPIFHVNKQRAIERTTGEWILQLDADERVTPALAEEIKSVISQKLPVNGYWIPRKNWFLGRFLTKGGQYPDYTLRLYRRGKGRFPCVSVHEHAEVEGKVDYLKSPLIHLADPNFLRYLTRFNRYTDLIASEIKAETQRKDIAQKILTPFLYLFLKPIWWFLSTYFRHKGFLDLEQGFLFSFFSSLRFPVAYLKYLKQKL